MRAAYRERRSLLAAELDRRLGEHIGPIRGTAGMHLVVPLGDVSADEVAARGTARGLDLRTLSDYARRPLAEEALVIPTILGEKSLRTVARPSGAGAEASPRGVAA